MAKRVNRKRTIVSSFNQVEKELDRPANGAVVLGLIIVIAIIMMGLVWQKVKVAQLSQETKQLENQVAFFKERNVKLGGQLLTLSNETRIVNIARNKLNMNFPPIKKIACSSNKINNSK